MENGIASNKRGLNSDSEVNDIQQKRVKESKIVVFRRKDFTHITYDVSTKEMIVYAKSGRYILIDNTNKDTFYTFVEHWSNPEITTLVMGQETSEEYLKCLEIIQKK